MLYLAFLECFVRDVLNAFMEVSVQHDQVIDFGTSIELVKDLSTELMHLMTCFHEVDLLKDLEMLEQLALLLNLLNEKFASLLLRSLQLLYQTSIDECLN